MVAREATSLVPEIACSKAFPEFVIGLYPRLSVGVHTPTGAPAGTADAGDANN